jgi:hypothetical protein
MPDYGEILAFLADNPPQLAAERELHASLLELLAQCLRSEPVLANADADLGTSRHGRGMQFN